MTKLFSSPTAIFGAGMMGTAIAAAHLRCGLPVVLFDSAEVSLQNAPQRISEELRLQNVSMPEQLLTCTGNLNEAAEYQIIIETITEKIKAKQKLYQNIITNRKSEGVLFSNTSTLSISMLAEPLPKKEQLRFCGFHFFHPVRQRSLIEIIAGKYTDLQTLETAKNHAARLDKRFITVGDAPGFLVNRILNPYLSSALQLLERKTDLQQIDRTAIQFGMKMGPFQIMDEIGLDVVLHAGWVLHKAFPERTPQSPILLSLIEQGKLGRKTGQGFMLYGRQTSWDGLGMPVPEFASAENTISESKIIKALFLPMYEEALRCYAEGIISDLATADLASIEALGFPAERGGIVTWGKGETT